MSNSTGQDRPSVEQILGLDPYRLLAENITEFVWSLSLQLQPIYMSPSVKGLLGWEVDEAMALPPDGMLMPQSLANAMKGMQEALANKAVRPSFFSVVMELEFKHREGHGVWTETTLRFIRDEQGVPQAILGVSRNIEARRHAQQRFRLAADVASDLIYEWDVDTDRLQWFGEIDQVLGLQPGQLPHTIESWVERIHREDRARLEEDVDRHRTCSDEIHEEYRIRHEDGSWRHWIDRGVPILDEHGLPRTWIGVCTDVTEQRLAERRLRESEERYRTLVETSPVGVFLHREGRVVFVNRAAASAIGETESARLIGRPVMEFVHPDYREDVIARMKLMQEQGRVGPTIEKLIRLDGEIIDVMISGSLSTYQDAPAFQVVFLDITEQVRAENEQARLRAQVQRAQKLESLGVLAGGIAHDFNNLLCGMLGAAELAVREEPANVAILESLDQIRDTALQASDLCRQLLAYSGRGRFVIEPLDLSILIEDMEHLLQLSASKKAVLRFALSRNLPNVEADKTQLRQIALNLLINASEAIGDNSGTIRVTTGVEDLGSAQLANSHPAQELEPGRYVFLEVADTGCGMDEETQGKVFDPFFTTKFTGRGLGLAATQGIVRGHRGAVEVHSELGQGTRFKVLLPASERRSFVVEPVQDSVEEWQGEGTVLVVDDEPMVHSVCRRILEKTGFKVLLAEDGRQGVEVFAEHASEIVLVLLDMTMPQLGGVETLREMRRADPQVLVLLTSGYNEREAISHFDGQEPAGFIQKPFEYEPFLSKIIELLAPTPGGTARAR